MLACIKCGKGKNTLSYSRHKKGSSGAGGTWALRAPIHQRVQYANLHVYQGKKYCTKCLRVVKPKFTAPVAENPDNHSETPVVA
jgi:hypothetical protein